MDSNLPPPDTCCAVCKEQCILECLKCQKCKNYIHTNCSELPIYAIVNFLYTRSHYACEECVKTNHSDESFAIVVNLLDREKESKGNKDVEDPIGKTTGNRVDNQVCDRNDGLEMAPLDSESEKTKTQQHLDKAPIENSNDQQVTKVCYYYKNNRCKYGRSDRGCPYAHPKLCNQYKINGLNPVKGCKRGKMCKFLHPPICSKSDRWRECLDLECKRLHLKGTRRYAPEQLPEQLPNDVRSRKPPSTRQTSRAARDQPLTTQPRGNNSTLHPTITYAHSVSANNKQPQSHCPDPTVSFLVQQMVQMQGVQQQILQARRIQPWQWSAPTLQGTQIPQ